MNNVLRDNTSRLFSEKEERDISNRHLIIQHQVVVNEMT